MGLEQVDQIGLVLFANAFQFEDFPEIGVGSVGNVDKVGLDEGFWWGRAYLEGFEDRVEAGHGLGDSFDVAWGWCGTGRGGECEEFFEAFLKDVDIQKHLIGSANGLTYGRWALTCSAPTSDMGLH